MSMSATRARVAATHGRCSALASGCSSARTLLCSSISGEIAKRRFATSSGPRRSVTIQLSLNPLGPRERRATLRGMDRHLQWEGCRNVRDLGGLGGIRLGALVRADSLARLTLAGWAA